MASNLTLSESNLVLNEFDKLKFEVKNRFKSLQNKLHEREVFILNRIDEMKTDHKDRRQEITLAIKQLELNNEQVMTTFTSNLLVSERDRNIKTIEEKLSDLQAQQSKITGNELRPELICNTDFLEKLINEIDVIIRDVITYIALYDYNASEEDEINFIKSDLIIMDPEQINDGWMFGSNQRTQKSGLVPYNYVKKL